MDDVVRIPLRGRIGKGMVAIIDQEDLPLVDGFPWYGFKPPRSAVVYARTYIETAEGIQTTRMMHQLLMADSAQVDHRDGDGLNNRRDNLRTASASQNRGNVGLRTDNNSGLKGACWDKSRGRWLAKIEVNQRQLYLGRFSTADAAAHAYDTAARKYFKEYARLNFPQIGERGLDGVVRRC